VAGPCRILTGFPITPTDDAYRAGGVHKSRTDCKNNSDLREEHVHELEFKLLLSKSFKGWNFAVNPLAAKNLSNNPSELGYAMGAGRPLALKASPNRCNFCPLWLR
jgi:hypothetical protein